MVPRVVPALLYLLYLLLVGLLGGVDITETAEEDDERDKDLHPGLHTVLPNRAAALQL